MARIIMLFMRDTMATGESNLTAKAIFFMNVDG